MSAGVSAKNIVTWKCPGFASRCRRPPLRTRRYGQKTAAGWYKYDDQRRAAPDPAVGELIRKWVEEAALRNAKFPLPKITRTAASTRW